MGSSLQFDEMDQMAERGTKPWALYFLYTAKSILKGMNIEAKSFREVLERLKDNNAAKILGFESFESMIQDQLKITPSETKAVLSSKTGQSIKEIFSPGRQRVIQAALATTGEVLPSYRPKEIEEISRQFVYLSQPERAEQNGVGIVTQKKLDALARDHPELFEQVRQGELSTHRAAVIAGIVKEPSLIDRAKKLATKMNHQELKELAVWLMQHMEERKERT